MIELAKEQNNASKRKLKIDNTHPYSLLNNKQDLPSLDVIKKAVIDYEENFVNKEDNRLKFNFIQFLKFHCRFCCLTENDKENNKILDIGKKILTLKLDLNYYLKLTDKFNRLKCLLLKPHQTFLLSNHKKFKLFSNKHLKHLDLVDDHFSSKNEAHIKIIQHIIQKHREQNFDSIDRVLYDKLDKNLKLLIEDLIVPKTENNISVIK